MSRLTLVCILAFSYSCEASVEREYTEWILARHRNAISCEEKYAKITPGHTACLQKSELLKKSGLEAGEQALILEAHNKARRDVNPSASNMQLMSWDASIANIAQRWAENCAADNYDSDYKRADFGRLSVGQNLAWGNYKMGWSKAISRWANEKKDYKYGGNNVGKTVADYTQMVWADSSIVGCGYAECIDKHHYYYVCKNGYADCDDRHNYYYVCNYGPAGNVVDKLPYISGTTCAGCPNRCNNGLCDCGGLICLNRGTLDLKQCKCTCLNPFHMQPNCALNCTGAVDINDCQSWLWSGQCELYEKIPYECPNMCKWCPFADIIECSQNPCQNGATCTDGINAYTCTCVAGWNGKNCDQNNNECSPNPCQNGATCTDGINAYTCGCVAGWNGKNCDQNINECSPNPCQNGATCSDGINAYSCKCVAGWDGKNCEQNGKFDKVSDGSTLSQHMITTIAIALSAFAFERLLSS